MSNKEQSSWVKEIVIAVIILLFLALVGWSIGKINPKYTFNNILEQQASTAVVALPEIKKLELTPDYKYQVECYSGPRVIVDPVNTNDLTLTESGYIVFVVNNKKISVKSNCKITERVETVVKK